MKIVFVAPTGSFTEQLKKALADNGAEVLYVNDREIKILPVFKYSPRLWRILRHIRVLKKLNNRLFERDLLRLCRSAKPDALLVNKGMIIKAGTLKTIKSMGIKTANWFPENINLPIYHDWFLQNAGVYDYFISFDSSVLDYRGNNFYVPVGVDPERFSTSDVSPEDHAKYDCDICFIGAYSADRERHLSAVADRKLKIFGWKGWEKSPLAKFYGGPLSLEESVKLYKCAKICVNLNTVPPVNGVNLKTFEIPMSGGFQLSDYRKDVDGLYDVGKEIAIFHNENELRELALFYLEHDDLRKQMAAAGRERALRDHTLKKRAAEILKILEN